MSKPVIVQSDNTLLLEVDNPDFEAARDEISRFAELEKSPEHIHTYRITALSLWNAASLGLSLEEILSSLKKYSRYDIPQVVTTTIQEQYRRYGILELQRQGEVLVLRSHDPLMLREIVGHKSIRPFLCEQLDESSIVVKSSLRGHVKQALIKLGFPVKDLAGYEEGEPCDIRLREITASGHPFTIRQYQHSAINAFYRGGGLEGGSGVIVLPCGSGKTIVGIGIMSLLKTVTLILVTNTVAIRQWKEELLDKTYLTDEMIGEYSGEKKEIRPITIATYNILTYRKKKEEDFVHFNLFMVKNWGLVIYDEVHLLPAPVFRFTAEIQSKRRLGLTATLIREDGLETEVFSLIGPKKFDMPWKVLERSSWIAEALCVEVRLALPESLRMHYAIAGDREKFRIASENYRKIDVVEKILRLHPECSVLIIGQYLTQLTEIARRFNFPLITGNTPVSEREALYAKFKKGVIKTLVVSKVANFSIDLPDANVAIQVSGTFGSRQEEAQRLGRILRPKKGDNRAYFYTIISSNTVEEKFAHNRQLFLTEQGYAYTIRNEEAIETICI
ncbi:MAG: DEAD/DEAH box helicase [Spirochaetes bacterium]|nr:DEAD/DEAH box helicase [Spirochaetota bacterium]